MKMKIINITNIDRFFEVIGQCKGKVELLTPYGDCLNLKSKLSQYYSLAQIFSDGNIPELELRASDPDDLKLLVDYLIQG